MRIGVFGGSFDPIHHGHLSIADEARVALGLDHVLLVPAAHQPLKHGRHCASAEQRLRMTSLAVASNPGLAVSDIELRRTGPSYSVDTLEELQAQHGADCQLWFIMGADALCWLPKWHRVERLLELAQIVAFGRPNSQLDLAALQAALPGLRLTFREGPQLSASSTTVRERVATGLPVRYLVPDAVANAIAEYGLYQQGDRR